MIKLFLQHGPEIDAKNYLGETALLVAVESKNAEHVKLLLEMGADTDVEDMLGNTLLSAAAKLNAFDIVKILLPLSTNAQIKKFHAAMESQENLNDIFSELLDILKKDVQRSKYGDECNRILRGLKRQEAELMIFRLLNIFSPGKMERVYASRLSLKFIMERDNKDAFRALLRMKRICENFSSRMEEFGIGKCKCVCNLCEEDE